MSCNHVGRCNFFSARQYAIFNTPLYNLLKQAVETLINVLLENIFLSQSLQEVLVILQVIILWRLLFSQCFSSVIQIRNSSKYLESRILLVLHHCNFGVIIKTSMITSTPTCHRGTCSPREANPGAEQHLLFVSSRAFCPSFI